MANATTHLSSPVVVAAGTCTPLPEKSTTGFVTCQPSESGTSTGVGRHPVFSASPPGSSSKPPPTSSPILLPITYSPSGHPVARSGWPAPWGLHAAPKSSSGRPSQSPFIFPQSVATVNPYPTHSLVSASLPTAARPLIPNSHVSNSHSSYPLRDGMPSNASYKPYRPSPATTTHSMVSSTSCSEMPGRLQSIFSTVATTVTYTPRSTFPAPVSIAETTDGQPTLSVPSVTNMGMTTLAGGAAVSNPVQHASSSSAGRSFFGNHPVVISVLLVSGIAIPCVVILALYCCRRRRRKQTEHRRRRLQDISPPFPQTPFKVGGDTKPLGGSSNQTATMQNYISVPLNRSGESLPVVAHSKIDDTPLPRPAPRLRTSRSSHRVPVPYSDIGAQRDSSRTVDWQHTVPFSDYHPVQVVQTHPSPNEPPPPPLPERSPLRLLAVMNSLNTPPENPNRLSAASSLSLYPPSSSTYEAVVAPENNPGMDYGRKKVGNYAQAPGLGSVNSGGASLPWRVHHALVENPVSGTGPTETSILDEVCRTVPLTQVPRAALGRYKIGR